MVHKSCKFNQQLIMLWVEENKAVFVAILFLMLCFGIMDTVVFVINNTFLHVTTVGRNVWLDWLFIIITSLLGYGVWKSWIKVEKRIAPKTIALILPGDRFLAGECVGRWVHGSNCHACTQIDKGSMQSRIGLFCYPNGI